MTDMRMRKSRNVVALLVGCLLLATSLVGVVPTAQAADLITAFAPAATLAGSDDGTVIYLVDEAVVPDNVYFSWDFSKGLDRAFGDDIAKITLTDLDAGTEVGLDYGVPTDYVMNSEGVIQAGDFKYTKEGSGSDPNQSRCLEFVLKSTSLKPGTRYALQIAAEFHANNGNALGQIYRWEFTTRAEEGPVTPPAQNGVMMRFTINQNQYFVNDAGTMMDAAPVILNDRTLLPVRYVAEPLGAVVDWDGVERKVTITTDTKTIELWIDNNIARVNGADTAIDPNNDSVKPVILPPGRTMLPLRFIAENLGCEVEWDGTLQQVTVTQTTN